MPTQPQQTDPSIKNHPAPFKVASATGGNVLLSSDKIHFLDPDNARHLAFQLQIAADNAQNIISHHELLLPFTQREITILRYQQMVYERHYQTKFSDLGEFVSHVVAQQLQEVNHA